MLFDVSESDRRRPCVGPNDTPVAGYIGDLVTGDFDGDGYLDIVVETDYLENPMKRFWHALRSGRLSRAARRAYLCGTKSISIGGDFDGMASTISSVELRDEVFARHEKWP